MIWIVFIEDLHLLDSFESLSSLRRRELASSQIFQSLTIHLTWSSIKGEIRVYNLQSSSLDQDSTDFGQDVRPLFFWNPSADEPHLNEIKGVVWER